MQRCYFDYFDARALRLEYPLGQAFLDKFCQISRDQLWQEQNERFKRLLARAWRMDFYRRLWGAHGIQSGDIRSLHDLPKLPCFSKTELMQAMAERPPLGDFHGRDSYPAGEAPPLLMHTTSGTTGIPQPLFFGPKGREIQNLLLARIYLLQGLRDDDVVHSVYGHGLINGGHFVREAVLHFTRALFLSAGTGIETRSARQLELMRDFRVTVLVGFADYLKKLAQLAGEMKLSMGEDIRVRMICGHLGRESREQMSALFAGAELYDWYGVGDTGPIAAEGPDRDGLYLMEDAQYAEVLDVDSGRPLADGEQGDLVVTTLYKDDIYPLIRFNTHDVTRISLGSSSLGLNLKRMAGFLGRSDQMVKLRGINVFPQALGPILSDLPGFTGEFLCEVTRDSNGRDEMCVSLELSAASDEQLLAMAKERLRASLGVEVQTRACAPGELAARTGIESRQKPVRLLDLRFS